MAENLEALRAEIEALSPPDRLRLAAGLLEQRRPEMTRMAKTIIERVNDELGVELLLAMKRTR